MMKNLTTTLDKLCPKREVYIGDNVMIGSNTLISTVNHPLTPMGRRQHLGIAKPMTIGNDVWIGGNVTILPGVFFVTGLKNGRICVTINYTDNVIYFKTDRRGGS